LTDGLSLKPYITPVNPNDSLVGPGWRLTWIGYKFIRAGAAWSSQGPGSALAGSGASSQSERHCHARFMQCQIYAPLWAGGWFSQLVEYLILLSVQLKLYLSTSKTNSQ